MGINGRVRRMDSMMIESNIRKLSRLELIYTCIAKLVFFLSDSNASLISEELKIVENEKRRLRTKEDGTMNSTALQNSSDPEATFRKKAGKNHRGYAANLEESVGANGSVVTDYQYEQNIYSDSQFFKEHLEQMEEQEKRVTIITDGAYSGTENNALAEAKNIELITTSLTGKETPEILADFVFNEDGTKVLHCPADHAPKSCTYMKPSGQCYVSFEREKCIGCPYQNKCNPKIFKRVAKIVTSKTAHERALIQRTFGNKIMALNFRKLFNFKKGLGHYAPKPVLV